MGSRSVAQGMPGHPRALPTYDRSEGKRLLPPLGGSLGFCKGNKGFHATRYSRLGHRRLCSLAQLGHRAVRIGDPQLRHAAQLRVEIVELEHGDRLALAVRSI